MIMQRIHSVNVQRKCGRPAKGKWVAFCPDLDLTSLRDTGDPDRRFRVGIRGTLLWKDGGDCINSVASRYSIMTRHKGIKKNPMWLAARGRDREGLFTHGRSSEVDSMTHSQGKQRIKYPHLTSCGKYCPKRYGAPSHGTRSCRSGPQARCASTWAQA